MPFFRRVAEKFRAFRLYKAVLPGGLLMAGGLLVAFVIPATAHACGLTDVECIISTIVIKLFQLLTALMGYLLIMEVDALIRVATYANFVSPGPTAVQLGWIVARDLANMFFIVFLLVIAFDTIIQGGDAKYAYRQNLQKMLIMAVVINFSKTICGLFIDLSQVLMLTFVNGFKEAAAGNFLSAFQIQKLLNLAEGTTDPNFGLVLAMMLAFVLAAVAACVVLVMLVMMTFRIVMLWVLVILSPIAFLTGSFPLGSNYYAQWWSEMKKYLSSGPTIAFFLWLALASAQKTPGGLANEQYDGGGGFSKQTTASAGETQTAQNFQGYAIPSEAGRADTILSLVIVTCIMFAGLKAAAEAGVAGSGFAKTVRGKVEGALKRTAMAPVGMASGAFQSVGGRAMNRAGAGLANIPYVRRIPIVGGALGAIGRRMSATGEKLEESRRQETEKRWAGSAKELAKYSPTQFASKTRMIGATDAQKLETIDAMVDRPEALAASKKSGLAKKLLGEKDSMIKKDPSRRAAFEKLEKAAWDQIEDPNARKAVLGRMNEEDVGKYVGAGQISDEVFRSLSRGAAVGQLTNGKDDKKAAIMGALSNLNATGSLEAALKEKRMNFSDIPAEAYAHAALSGTGLKKSALTAAEKDPALMKRFADDPKMRDVLSSTARDNFNAAATDIDKVQSLKTMSMLGEAKPADYGTAPAGSPPGTPSALEEAAGQLSIRELNEMERNTPTDSPAALASLERTITAALKNGPSELAQAILRSPTLSQRVPLSDARAAEKATPGFTGSVTSAANASMANLDRQRKAAAPAAAAALAAQISDLDTALKGLKTAAQDLSTAEEHVVTLRENYDEAKKSGTPALAASIASTLKTAMRDASAKRALVAAANRDVKSKS